MAVQQPETPRMKALRNLAQQLPVANQQIAQGQQAARDIQLQQAVQKAPAQTAITPAAQGTGAAMATEAGVQQVQRAQDQLKQGQQVGALGLQEQSRAAESRIAGQKAGLREQEMDNINRFAQISERAKQELFDKQMKFQKDESGRALFNTTQLADYAMLNARNEEQLRNYQQSVQLASKRKTELLQAAYNKMEEQLKFEYSKDKQKRDQEAEKIIAKRMSDMKKRIAESKAQGDSERAKWEAISGAFGGAVSAVASS